MGVIKFIRDEKPSDSELMNLDHDTIYFFSDTSEIYLGSTCYAESKEALGFSEDGRSINVPASASPKSLGAGSMLVTEASNTTLGKKSLSVTTGMGLTVNSAPAGSTSYTVTNTYVNRIICMLAIGGVACLNENDAANTVNITSVTVGGTSLTPSSTNSSTPIIITTAESVNPNTSTTSIRIYPKQTGFSTLYAGTAGSSESGYSIIAGQNVYNAANAGAIFGNAQYNTGNASLLGGRQHINTKQNVFMAGQGHDSTNGSNGVAAVGTFSSITLSTLFAVGNGTSNTVRSNAFEVTSDGIILKSPNGQRYLISVNNAGTISAIAVN